MAIEHEYGYKTRVLKILIAIVNNPFYYSKFKLAQMYGVSKDTITNDFESIKNVGFIMEYDDKFRYALKQDKPLKKLHDLLHFSTEDQVLLHDAIDSISSTTKRSNTLKQKLASLYDFKKLGYVYLRKPYLSKVDLLIAAKDDEKQVILEGYSSSNSNTVMNRKVEPIHISPPEDTLQAYDIGKSALRHFRMSRIKRVKILDTSWQYKSHHLLKRTDAFRIVDNEQVIVEMNMRIGAKNELIERFPMTKAYVSDDSEEDKYYFQAPVNHNFLGLSNFILGHHHTGIEVLGPELLIDHLRMMVEALKF